MDGIRVFGGIEHLTVLKNPETYGVLPYPLAIPPIFRGKLIPKQMNFLKSFKRPSSLFSIPPCLHSIWFNLTRFGYHYNAMNAVVQWNYRVGAWRATIKHQGTLFEVSSFQWPRLPKCQFTTCLLNEYWLRIWTRQSSRNSLASSKMCKQTDW